MPRSAQYVLLVLLTLPALAQASAPADPLFQENTVLEITIEAPWTTLLEERNDNDQLPAVLSYREADGTPRVLNVTVHAHGNYRRKPENCDFPPITLDFTGSENISGVFTGQKKLRFVNHCKRGSERYEQLVLREYLAYRLFNLFTPISYRARLFRITYVDSEGGNEEETSYAFASEHESRFAVRNDLEFLDLPRISVSQLDGTYLNLTSVYQFFIGNTDFSPVAGKPDEECCHNYALYSDSSGRHFAVPYDFDWAGLVNAPYAVPNPRFRIRNVRQRIYRGRCANNDHLDDTIESFREHRDAIYAVIESLDPLTDATTKQVSRYVDEFYKIIDKPSHIDRKIASQCIR